MVMGVQVQRVRMCCVSVRSIRCACVCGCRDLGNCLVTVGDIALQLFLVWLGVLLSAEGVFLYLSYQMGTIEEQCVVWCSDNRGLLLWGDKRVDIL
jgi:hypothetical protein